MAADKTDKWFVYILECADGTLYTGSTNDLEKRVETHNSGNGAKYTKARLPVKLVYHEEFDDKRDAMKREWHIKHKLSRKQKMELVNSK